LYSAERGQFGQTLSFLRQGAWVRRCGVTLTGVRTAHIDDDGALPGEVLLKSTLNYVQCVIGCAHIAARNNSHEKVHFANAHELAKQIVGKEGIFGQSAYYPTFVFKFVKILQYDEAAIHAIKFDEAETNKIDTARA
jgi:hypothetical protein